MWFFLSCFKNNGPSKSTISLKFDNNNAGAIASEVPTIHPSIILKPFFFAVFKRLIASVNPPALSSLILIKS